jgi:outer membrane protein TolC
VELAWEKLYFARARGGLLTDELQTSDALHATVGVGKKFRNGIEIRPGISVYLDSNASSAQTLGLTVPRPEINLTIPLLRGFGEDSADAAAESAAAHMLNGARSDRAFSLQKSLHDTVQLYWRCLASKLQVEILKQGEEADSDYANSVRQLAKGGFIEPTVRDRIEAMRTIHDMDRRNAMAAAELCRRNLGIAMNLPASAGLPDPVGEFPSMENAGNTLAKLKEEDLVEQALLRRGDVHAASQYMAAESDKVRGARNQTDTGLTVSVSTTRASVRLDRSLNGDLAEGELAQATAGENEARLNLQDIEGQVRRDVGDTLRGARDGFANWTALKHAADLFARIATDAKKRAEAGIITWADYRDIRNDMTAVQGRLVDAQLQYASNLAGLRLASGTLTAADGTPEANMAQMFRVVPNP